MENVGKKLNNIVNFPEGIHLELEKLEKLKPRKILEELDHDTKKGEVVSFLGKKEKREKERKE